jgi:hypothetical protein
VVSVQDQVAALIKAYPPAKDDNNLLVVLFWQVADQIDIPGNVADKISRATSVETIVRARRDVIERAKMRETIKEILIGGGKEDDQTG